MKKRQFLLSIFLISHIFLFGQELSNSIYNNLRKNGYSPKTQSLVISGENNFSYNILLDFPSEEESEKNLALVFFQDDFESNSREIFKALDYINKNKYSFDIHILLSYGDKQIIQKQGMVYGNRSFINNLNTNEDFTVIIFNLNSKKNIVNANSNSRTSPSWLIKNEFDCFVEEGISENLPFFYLSQIFSYNFFYDRLLSDFFDTDIPAIKVSISETVEKPELIFNLIRKSVEKFKATPVKEWDQHFLMMRYFTHYLNLTESMTIKIIIVMVFCWLFFIFTFVFVNMGLKHYSWQRVRKIIYVVPVTFLLLIASFFLGLRIFQIFQTAATDAGKIYALISIQLIISIIFISIFYLFVMLNTQNFARVSVDYLILISCFINQSIFILVDISLFPIFMIICFLSIFALIFRKNFIHIIIFILMISLFIPYGHYIITYAQLSDLRLFLTTNWRVPIALSLILYPICIVYLRILTTIRKETKRYSTTLIVMSSIIAGFVLVIVLTSNIRIRQINKTKSAEDKVLISSTRENLIDLSYSDKEIFDDTIRTLNISIRGKPVQCDVRIISSSGNPILYTDNDYETASQKVVLFRIPSYPPSDMTFSYGTNGRASTITVTAFFETESENQFTMCTQSIHTGRSYE